MPNSEEKGEDVETSPKSSNDNPIAQILSSQGPLVQCVVLRHIRKDGKDTRPHTTSSDSENNHHERPVLVELIDEVTIDTTPSAKGVQKVLGTSNITFVGQFPTEGTVVMAKQELPVLDEEVSVKELRNYCREWNIDTTGMVEKSELINALQQQQDPVNPHKLQPPLDGLVVHGDMLILKVAEDDDDDEEIDLSDPEAMAAQMQAMSNKNNDSFFLNYTKEDYTAFARRTDIVAPEPPEEGDDEEDEGEDEDDDEEYDPEEGEAEFMTATMNVIMGECLKQFRQEHGRGPDTKELLELRSRVAEKLGVEVASFEQVEENTEQGEGSCEKRQAEEDPSNPAPKRVKFTKSTTGREDIKQDNATEDVDQKLSAKSDGVSDDKGAREDGDS